MLARRKAADPRTAPGPRYNLEVSARDTQTEWEAPAKVGIVLFLSWPFDRS